MSIRFLIPTLLITILLYACSPSQPVPFEQDVPTAPASQPDSVDPTVEPMPGRAQEVVPVAETTPPDCLGDEVSPIGDLIAEEYDFTSYEDVMTWFCNGAEFEDILLALETESQTGMPAEEMLQMLADGFTWEEIWQLIGLTE